MQSGAVADAWISMGGHNQGAAVEVDAIEEQQLKWMQLGSSRPAAEVDSIDIVAPDVRVRQIIDHQTSAQRAAQCSGAYVGSS